ncbi:MAG: TonB-dependent receptor, partial [Steroidobacteraceae bacterium]
MSRPGAILFPLLPGLVLTFALVSWRSGWSRTPRQSSAVSRPVPGSLPGFDTTYRLATRTDVYLQVSRGSLIPSQAFLYTANPALGDQARPENALAAQVGVVPDGTRYGIALDAYRIDFDNYV